MASPKNYSTFADFERDHLRPDMRIGWSSSDEIESSGAQELDSFAHQTGRLKLMEGQSPGVGHRISFVIRPLDETTVCESIKRRG